MADSKYGKYIISTPLIVGPGGSTNEGVKGVTFPKEFFINTGLAKGCPSLVDIGWHFTIPDPDPVEQTHSHDFDTVSCFVGSDPKNPSRLGAVVEIQLGDEKHILTKTCVIFIPKGLEHCPLIHRSVDRPYLQIVFAISDEKQYIASQLKGAVLP
ncbi:MAG: hypothetical protein GY729_07530 [Desulfobacteraceae bacterium]|nr:hypothetical protein [Desulfobacteraceae bacterium]